VGTQYLIGAAFVAAPENYHTVLDVTADIKGNDLDIDDLEKAMYNMCRQGGGKSSADNMDNGFGLAAFTGTCYVCKNKGHKATDCPNMNNGGGGNGGNKG
jgi:translation elongation factor EF-1beta